MLMWDLYNEHGFDAHNQSEVFKGNLLAVIKEHFQHTDQPINGVLF